MMKQRSPRMTKFTPTIPDLATPELIRHTRLKLGLTQTQAANLLGITLGAWQCYEADPATTVRNVDMPLGNKYIFLDRVNNP